MSLVCGDGIISRTYSVRITTAGTPTIRLIRTPRREQLTSRIDTRYALADTPEALRYLESQRARGKVIITVGESPE